MTADTIPTATLLNNLNEALSAAVTAFPTDEQVILPPVDGISLLDVKNDLLLSYLQNLAFLILIRLRSSRNGAEPHKDDLNTEVIQKLIELRVYIERGVRPLEGRLRYQIDKILRAAEEKERLVAHNDAAGLSTKKTKKATDRARKHQGADASNSGSDSEFTDDDGSEGSDDDDEVDDNAIGNIEETLHRPNALALARQVKDSTKPSSSSTRPSSRTTTQQSTGGTYKPPRITPTSMPEPASSARNRAGADERSRRRKTNLLDEYIDEELSAAPKAQPSIGSNSTILARGRGGTSTRDREKERERTEYEETNLVRLPAESKAERRKAARSRGDGNRRDTFGGEDWTGLGGLGDRINRSVQQGKGAKVGVLERREKRRRGEDTRDGQRGDGLGMGEKFAKRQKILEDRAERKRRKGG